MSPKQQIIVCPRVLHTYTSIQTLWCLWSIPQTVHNIQVRQTWKRGWWKSKFGSDAREFLSHKIFFKTLMISWCSDKCTTHSLRSLWHNKFNSRQVDFVYVNFALMTRPSPCRWLADARPFFQTGQSHAILTQQLTEYEWRHCLRKLAWVVFMHFHDSCAFKHEHGTRPNWNAQKSVPELKDRYKIESMDLTSA